MRKTRGFKITRKLVKVFKCGFHARRKAAGYDPLGGLPSCRSDAMSRICGWLRCLKRGAKTLCSFRSTSGYIPVGREPFDTKPATAPKGHLAVYVCEKEEDPHRFMVPVIYFNHPLFGELLKEAAEKYGFHHPGGITIPCRISEFENVQTRIAAGQSCRNLTWDHRY